LFYIFLDVQKIHFSSILVHKHVFPPFEKEISSKNYRIEGVLLGGTGCPKHRTFLLA